MLGRLSSGMLMMDGVRVASFWAFVDEKLVCEVAYLGRYAVAKVLWMDKALQEFSLVA